MQEQRQVTTGFGNLVGYETGVVVHRPIETKVTRTLTTQSVKPSYMQCFS
jgi:hypothetical protein